MPNVDRTPRAVAAAFKGCHGSCRTAASSWAPRARRSGWSTGPARDAQATDIAGYLLYNGVGVSAPNQRVPQRAQDTRIVVYNGVETKLTATLAYLQSVFKATPTIATDRRSRPISSSRPAHGRRISRRPAPFEVAPGSRGPARAPPGCQRLFVSQAWYCGRFPPTAAK